MFDFKKAKPLKPLDEKPWTARAVSAVEDKLPYLGTGLLMFSLLNFNNPFLKAFLSHWVAANVQNAADCNFSEKRGHVYCDDDYSNAQVQRLLSIVSKDEEVKAEIDALQKAGWTFHAFKDAGFSKNFKDGVAHANLFSKKIGLHKETLKDDAHSIFGILHEIRHGSNALRRRRLQRDIFENPDTLFDHLYVLVRDVFTTSVGQTRRYNLMPDEKDANDFAHLVMQRSFPMEHALYKFSVIDEKLSTPSVYLHGFLFALEGTLKDMLGLPEARVYVQRVSSGDYSVSVSQFGFKGNAVMTLKEAEELQKIYRRFVKIGKHVRPEPLPYNDGR